VPRLCWCLEVRAKCPGSTQEPAWGSCLGPPNHPQARLGPPGARVAHWQPGFRVKQPGWGTRRNRPYRPDSEIPIRDPSPERRAGVPWSAAQLPRA
jgi:hypothetical protein